MHPAAHASTINDRRIVVSGRTSVAIVPTRSMGLPATRETL